MKVVRQSWSAMRGFRLQLLAVLLLTMMLLPPGTAFAQSVPDINGDYYKANVTLPLYNMDSTLVATYRGIGFHVTAQSDNAISGHVDLYQATSVRGTAIASGTGELLPISLREGTNHVVVYTAGIHNITLPTGVQAVATSDSASVSGSPVTLTSSGNITTTTNGLFTLVVSIKNTTVGTFTGLIGEGSKARIQMVGTQPYATVDDDGGTATVTDAPVKAVPASTTINVSVAGTFHVDMPYGMYGTATSGSATLSGSPVTLVSGNATTLDTGATTGTVTIATQMGLVYNISGLLKINRSGDVIGINGRADGFIVLNNNPWQVLVFDRTFNASKQ